MGFPHVEWPRERDIELIENAHMGLITEGIAERMSIKRGAVHSRLSQMGVNLDKIRQWKREGKTVQDIMKWIDDRRDPIIPESPHNTLLDLLATAVKQQGQLLDTWGRVEALFTEEAKRERQETEKTLFTPATASAA